MKPDFDPFADDAARPSRLQLDRFAAGELTGGERSVVQQWIAKNAYAVAHLDELRNAKKNVRPFDAMLLRARAGGIGGERQQSSGMETFPPGVLDGVDLAALVRDDLDRSTQPFADERSAEPAQQGSIEGTNPGLDEARRGSSEGRAPTAAAPANRPMWMFLAPLAAVAAAALIAVGVGLSGTNEDGPGIRTRGAADLEVRVLDGGTMRAYDGKPLAAGATVGFAVAPGAHHSVVIVSVDSAGVVSTWVPASGAGSTPIEGSDSAIVALNASVTLDATPGKEVFVAVFDQQTAAVIADVDAQFKQGGAAGVAAWADKAPDADAVVVEKR